MSVDRRSQSSPANSTPCQKTKVKVRISYGTRGKPSGEGQGEKGGVGTNGRSSSDDSEREKIPLLLLLDERLRSSLEACEISREWNESARNLYRLKLELSREDGEREEGKSKAQLTIQDSLPDGSSISNVLEEVSMLVDL